MTQTASRHIRFRGRSFPALALEPEAPLAGWIEKLDAYLACSPAFFSRKAIVIDVARLDLTRPALVELLHQLAARKIRALGVAGVDPAWASDDLPPILAGGRDAPLEAENAAAKTALTREELAAFEEIAGALKGKEETALAEDAAPQAPAFQPLVIEAPVRSGQTIFYPQGDVIVIGSVSSGADVIAGGSIHIYGTLRGRAMAGAYGETQARIFCRRLEAELLAVGGVYLTADEINAQMLSQNVHIWLEREDVKIARLD
ncbi:MAG: septum site-determining protein MinC [Methylocystis sp.]|uniref:septum site-determining protein MinC n=1 Tax=Methylocystis sp. TaxID=1911079 RepID=UPI003DA54DD3